MTKTARCLLGVAAGAWFVSTLAAATPSSPSAAQASQTPGKPPEDPAAGLFLRLCSDCHDATRVVSRRRTTADWEDMINKMVDKGATGTDKELETVFDYLLRTYGKVYINTAQPGEIATILGLSQKDADAIVAFRKANGPFADFAAVKKVPEIDVTLLDAHKDAVAF